MRHDHENAECRDFSKEKILEAASEILGQYEAVSSYFQEHTQERELHRIAFTLSQIPVATNTNQHIVDLGGTVLWVPLYHRLLGYKKITVVRREAEEYLRDYDFAFMPEAVVEACDAELDIEPYDIADDCVDCAVCFEVLEHLIGDPMHLMNETNRILKTGGMLVMSTPNVLFRERILYFLFGRHPFSWSVYTGSYGDRHNREWTPFELEELYEVSGFNEVRVLTADPRKEKPYGGGLKGILKSFLTFALCLLPHIAGKVPMRLRDKVLFSRGRRATEILDRYPPSFYEMFGRQRMVYEIPIQVRGRSDRTER